VLDADWSADADGLSDVDNALGHQGLHLDTESALYYNRNRYFSPALGRFIQRDPLGYIDGMNQYEYIGDSPSGSQDPAGTSRSFGNATLEKLHDEIRRDLPQKPGMKYLKDAGLRWIDHLKSAVHLVDWIREEAKVFDNAPRLSEDLPANKIRIVGDNIVIMTPYAGIKQTVKVPIYHTLGPMLLAVETYSFTEKFHVQLGAVVTRVWIGCPCQKKGESMKLAGAVIGEVKTFVRGEVSMKYGFKFFGADPLELKQQKPLKWETGQKQLGDILGLSATVVYKNYEDVCKS
jgi:RHS repeat-associated protein